MLDPFEKTLSLSFLFRRRLNERVVMPKICRVFFCAKTGVKKKSKKTKQALKIYRARDTFLLLQAFDDVLLQIVSVVRSLSLLLLFFVVHFFLANALFFYRSRRCGRIIPTAPSPL
jgi:hypothetical protein